MVKSTLLIANAKSKRISPHASEKFMSKDEKQKNRAGVPYTLTHAKTRSLPHLDVTGAFISDCRDRCRSITRRYFRPGQCFAGVS